jgi:hypothetical protein
MALLQQKTITSSSSWNQPATSFDSQPTPLVIREQYTQATARAEE